MYGLVCVVNFAIALLRMCMKISKIRCWTSPDHASFCFGWDSNSFSLSLTCNFRISCSLKSSPMILTSWLLFLFQGTPTRTTNALFQNSRVPVILMMPHCVFLGIPIVVSCLWFIASIFLARWNHRLWFWLLDYFICLRLNDTRYKCSVSKFPVPDNPDHASFCFC